MLLNVRIFGDFLAIFDHNVHISTVEYRTGREKIKDCPISLLSKNVNNFSVAHPRPELEPFPFPTSFLWKQV